MARRSDKAERITLLLFKQAYRQNRLDVASILCARLRLWKGILKSRNPHVAGAP